MLGDNVTGDWSNEELRIVAYLNDYLNDCI
jgi:hypothetical protein